LRSIEAPDKVRTLRREVPEISVRPSEVPLLSAEEAEVLARIATGMTDQEIADAMGASLGQVRWLIRSALATIGARNRPNAVTRGRVRLPRSPVPLILAEARDTSKTK
jgi:DNA-binding CsgD family transcriptional regulator